MGLQILNSAAALVFVLCLIGIVSILLRKYSEKISIKTSQQKRLKISDSFMIDQKRKLVLVKRDDKEHLILLSPEGHLIIEKDIITKDINEN